jgi:hypothetical protein
MRVTSEIFFWVSVDWRSLKALGSKPSPYIIPTVTLIVQIYLFWLMQTKTKKAKNQLSYQLKKSVPKVLKFSRKIKAKQWFPMSIWINLTSFDECKCLNHSKGRVAYMTYLRGEKRHDINRRRRWMGRKRRRGMGRRGMVSRTINPNFVYLSFKHTFPVFYS